VGGFDFNLIVYAATFGRERILSTSSSFSFRHQQPISSFFIETETAPPSMTPREIMSEATGVRILDWMSRFERARAP